MDLDAGVLPPVFPEAAEHESDIRRPFSEAAHEVGIPLVAERHVDPHTVALLGEPELEVAADAVEQLELVAVRRD